MDYSPSAKDFDKWDKEFTPNEEHFNQWDAEMEPQQSSIAPIPLNKYPEESRANALQEQHPFLFGLAKKLQNHPTINKALESAAESPITEAGLSAQPALVNAFKNVANLSPLKFNIKGEGLPNVEARNLYSKPLVEKTERAFPEPSTLKGKLGSLAGSILGGGTAFLASPASSTIPGALATGFAEGEGGVINRSVDALIGTLFPGLIHTGKFAKQALKSKEATKNIKNLELEKTASERDVFSSKEKLAKQLNEKSTSVTENKSALTDSLNKLAGESESEAKANVSKELVNASKSIEKKYNGLYEGFNSSKAGQSAVKEPVKIESLEKEYGLKEGDFSPDTKQLINKIVGKSKEIPESEHISVITGKPTNQASIEFKNTKEPKVADYINLWKQLRAEVADYRHSMKTATTPEAKRTFREKANKLEQFSDEINHKAMSSLDAKDAAKYSDIQKGYLKERVPFLEENILKRATGKQPKVPDSFFNKLNESGISDLIQTFKSSHPALVNAITKHDIRGLSKLGVEDLNELIHGDFGRFINTTTRNQLNSLQGHKTAESLLKKALGKVQSTEIGRKIHANDINNIIKEHPDLSTPFKNVEKEQERLRKLKDALVDEGFKKKAIDDALSKYKSIGSAAKSAAVPAAVTLGLKKKKSNVNELGEY
jgi:hypothetical protein